MRSVYRRICSGAEDLALCGRLLLGDLDCCEKVSHSSE